MKQLTNKEHLVYMLENSYLVTALPFVDQELDNQVPKSKVAYLIKTEQTNMEKNPHEYIKDLKAPSLLFADSDQFDREVVRVQQKLQQKIEGSKKKQSEFPQVPKKVTTGEVQKVFDEVNKGLLAYEGNLFKGINTEIYKRYGPLVLRELIEVLQKEKINLSTAIIKEKQMIESLNQHRKYDQTETHQRQSDIGERIKIMLNKRRKVE